MPKRTASVRSTRTFHEAAEEQVGQDRPRDMPSTGPARIEPAHIEPVTSPVSKEKLDALAFNEEVVTVLVHESTHPTDEPIVEVFNNRIPQRFLRGQEQQVKRKFVEILARAKKTVYSQERYMDANGNEGVRNVPQTALRYPFTVTNDPNPKGRAWLKAVLSEA